MSEPVAWALLWSGAGLVLGYFGAWLRFSVRQHGSNVQLAGLLRALVKAKQETLLLRFADRLEGKEPPP